MTSRLALLMALSTTACRKHVPEKPAPKTEVVGSASVPSSAPSVAPSSLVAANPIASAAPKVEVPALACVESSVIAFRTSPDEAFGCSPFKTGSAPLELTMAPGTTLELDLAVVMVTEKKAAKEAESKKEAAGDAGDDIEVPSVSALDKVTLKSAGLPKGALLDAAGQKLSWPVAGAEGEAFAFRIGAFVNIGGKNECITAPIVVRVKDDPPRRQAQLARILPRDAPEAPRSSECGNLTMPTMADLDGDGREDGYWTIGNRYDNDNGVTHVWFRRGDKFVHQTQLSRITTLYRAPGGTALFVARGGCCCHEDLDIWKVFSNRVESIVSLDLADDCSTSKAEISLSNSGGELTSYSTSYSSPSGSKNETFEWDLKAKRFLKK